MYMSVPVIILYLICMEVLLYRGQSLPLLLYDTLPYAYIQRYSYLNISGTTQKSCIEPPAFLIETVFAPLYNFKRTSLCTALDLLSPPPSLFLKSCIH